MIPAHAAQQASNNLLGWLLALIAKLPPEGVDAVAQLLRAVHGSKDPLRSVRLAAMVVASKAVTTAAIEKVIGK